VMILARHRTESSHLPKKPLHHLYPVAEPSWQVLAGLLAQVQQDGARLEHRNWLASTLWIMVDDRRHAVVGRNRQKFWLKLFALADIDRHDPVGDRSLLKKIVILCPFGVVQ